MKTGCLASPSSSPPTPPSPLPISVGPGNRAYPFSPSLSPSPPFSLPNSRSSSPETSPLLCPNQRCLHRPKVPSAFSLDKYVEDPSPPTGLWLLKRWWVLYHFSWLYVHNKNLLFGSVISQFLGLQFELADIELLLLLLPHISMGSKYRREN